MGVFQNIVNRLGYERASRTNDGNEGNAKGVKQDVLVGADIDIVDGEVVQSFSNDNITFSGSLSGYNYDSLLRDKQGNIVSLYE